MANKWNEWEGGVISCVELKWKRKLLVGAFV